MGSTVSLPWRHLSRRVSAHQQVHPCRVLYAARAVSPPLALAKARARFLCRLFERGPKALLRILYCHWCQHASSSWLYQLQADVTYCPSLDSFLPAGKEVARLLEAASDPQWWPRQVAKAEAWIANPVPCIKERTAQPRDFRCEECGSSFLLRKHLHLQMAKSHRIFSPARHFTLSPACMMVWQHQAKPATPQTVAAVPGYGRPSHSSPGLQSDP